MSRWRRPWAACGALALVLTTTSACVGFVVETDPSPFQSMAPTCALTRLDTGAPVVHVPRITAVHEVVVKGGQVESSVLISDGPEEPRITWTALKTATVDDVLRWVPPEVRQKFSTGRSPGREQVSASVSGLGADDGKFIGYAAIRPVEVEFTGTCAGGGAISGYLIAWTNPDVGVVKCGAVLAASASAGSRLAQTERC
jgi:hypothetical protein